MSNFKILLIDNDSYQRAVTRQILFVGCPEIEIIDIATPKQYQNSLTRTDFTLVITEYDLGWTNGFLVFEDVRHRYPQIPVIMLSGYGDIKIAVEAIKRGILDYVEKKHADLLPKKISQFLQEIKQNNPYKSEQATLYNLTDRKRAEAFLRTSEERYRTLFDNSVEAIFINRNGNRIEQVNKACMQLWLACTPDDLIGKNPLELFHSDFHSLIKLPIQQATHNLETQPMIEEKIVRLDGTLADVLVSAIPFIDDQGPLLFVILLDITSRKQAETALQNSQRKQRELSNHLTLVREEESAHIARELHDELGSFLNILKLDVSWLNNQLPSSLTACREKTQIMLEQINESIENVKKIITDLRPSILDHLGLFPAIEWQVENLCKSTGIHCQLSLPEHDFPIDNIRCTAIFRIAQETLTNIIVHSKASKVIFNITINSDELLMTIIDNGTGMTTAQQTNSGYGILGMHERALHLGGELSIISSLETGVTVVLRMPIQDIRR